jgi:hypothetical protein
MKAADSSETLVNTALQSIIFSKSSSHFSDSRDLKMAAQCAHDNH